MSLASRAFYHNFLVEFEKEANQTDWIALWDKLGEWTTKIWMNRSGQEGLNAYWEAAYANVRTAYEAGLLSDAQWALYEELYENREVENGNVFPLPELFQVHLDGKAADGAAAGEYGPLLEKLKQPGVGEQMVLEQNLFVELVLRNDPPSGPLSDEIMAHYRAPFQTSKDRLPTLTWPREIPVAGEPADVYREVKKSQAWLEETALPKLLFYAEPGTLILTHVIAGSPAARAELKPGDRIYRIADRDFTDGRQFAEIVKTLSRAVELVVERDGQLRTVVLQIESKRSIPPA